MEDFAQFSPENNRGNLKPHPSGDLIMPFDTQFNSADFDSAFPADDDSPAGVEVVNEQKSRVLTRIEKKSVFDEKSVMNFVDSDLKRGMLRDATQARSAQRMNELRKEMQQDSDLTSFPEPEFAGFSAAAGAAPSGGRRRYNRRATMGAPLSSSSHHSAQSAPFEQQSAGLSRQKNASSNSLRHRKGRNNGLQQKLEGSANAEWGTPSRGGYKLKAVRRQSIGSTSNHSHFSEGGRHMRPGKASRRASMGSHDSSHSSNFASQHTPSRGGLRPGLSMDEDDFGTIYKDFGSDAPDMGYGEASPDMGYGSAAPDSGNKNISHPQKRPVRSRRASMGATPVSWDDTENAGYRMKPRMSMTGATVASTNLAATKRRPSMSTSYHKSPLDKLQSASRHSRQSSKSDPLTNSMHSATSRSYALPDEDPFGQGDADETQIMEANDVRRQVRSKMATEKRNKRGSLYNDSDDENDSDMNSFAGSEHEEVEAKPRRERSRSRTRGARSKSRAKSKSRSARSKSRPSKKKERDDEKKAKKRSKSRPKVDAEDDGKDKSKKKSSKKEKDSSLKKQKSESTIKEGGGGKMKKSGSLGTLDSGSSRRSSQKDDSSSADKKSRSKLSSNKEKKGLDLSDALDSMHGSTTSLRSDKQSISSKKSKSQKKEKKSKDKKSDKKKSSK